jgi:hypothetical protein
MGQWKSLSSPKLKVPLELREVTAPGAADRVWEVQELRSGSVFKVTLSQESLKQQRRPLRLSDAEAERAACFAVEEALITPPDKEPGMTYEIAVAEQELAEAVQSTD